MTYIITNDRGAAQLTCAVGRVRMNKLSAKEIKVVNLKGIRRQNVPYIWAWVLYYAWVVAFTVWWTAVPGAEMVFNLEIRGIIHTANMLSSTICVLLLKKEYFAKSARIGAISVLLMLGLFFVVSDPTMKTIAAVLLGMALGCVNISVLFPFVFLMNNTEKLCAIVLGHTLSNVFPLLPGNPGRNAETVLTAGILHVALFAVVFFKSEHLKSDSYERLNIQHDVRPAMILTLAASTLGAILFLGVGKAVLNIYVVPSGDTVLIWYFLGGISGSLLYALIFTLPRIASYLALSLPFGCLSIGLLCNAFTDRIPGMATAFGLLLGMGTSMGMSTVYYVLGVAGKKYSSILYVRLSIPIIGICGGVSGVVIGNWVDGTEQVIPISIVFTIVSSAAVIVVLVFSSTISRICFDDAWAGDVMLPEVVGLQQTADSAKEIDIFGGIHLTPREKEVCELLLKSLSIRQISAELGLAFATVNGYYRSLYRKLDISSKAELFMLFSSGPAFEASSVEFVGNDGE